MPASAQVTELDIRAIRNLRWWIGALLFASTVINKADRQTLSLLSIPETALPPDEFGLSLVG